MGTDRTLNELLWRVALPAAGLTPPLIYGLEAASDLEPAMVALVERIGRSTGPEQLEAKANLRSLLLQHGQPVQLLVLTTDPHVQEVMRRVEPPHSVQVAQRAEGLVVGERALLLVDLESEAELSAVKDLAARCALGAIGLRPESSKPEEAAEHDWLSSVFTKPLDPPSVVSFLAACGHARPRDFDPRTGLLERRRLLERIRLLWREADRSDEPLSLALIRLEALRSIREVRGIQAVEALIDQFVAVASDVLRGADLLGRWSEEEFLLVFPGTSPSGTVRALENLQDRLFHWPSTLPPLSFGAGVTSVRSGGSFADVLCAANAALYETGSSGKLPLKERTEEDQRTGRDAMAVLSHELRTPLTVIEGALGLIESGGGGDVSGHVKKLAKLGRANTDRLLDIVTDLIDLQSLREDQFELVGQELDIEELLSAACAEAEDSAREAEVALESQPWPGTFCGDRIRLQRVLRHLIRNAIESSPKGGTVRVRGRLSGDMVRFRVEDQGPGVDPERLDTLFAPFRQQDVSATRRKGGIGLGLAVCKGIVGKHGGQIGVQNLASGGASFWLEVHPLNLGGD